MVPPEDVLVGVAIMAHRSVILPWAAQKEVAHRHGHHITIHRGLVGSNLEGDLHRVLDLDGAAIAQPLHMIGVWMLLVLDRKSVV